MTIRNGNRRLPITLSPQKKKYGKSGSRIGQIALTLLIEQEKAGFQISALEK